MHAWWYILISNIRKTETPAKDPDITVPISNTLEPRVYLIPPERRAH
jgi:hypothetical protein